MGDISIFNMFDHYTKDMLTYKVSSPNHIRRLLDCSIGPDDIQEMTIKVNNVNRFLEGLLPEIQEESDWPLAVNPALIINPEDETEVKMRASHIIEVMLAGKDLYGLKFLDFGCGSGHVAMEALSRSASSVVGYDIKAHHTWQSNSAITFTTDWKAMAEKGPYDLILLYDVLDHVMDKDPGDVLSDLGRLLSANGEIIIRFHPWISRHGMHLYTKINRAYLHLIFGEEQLKEAGLEIMPTRKVIHPMMTYKNWITKSGLKIIKEDKLQEPVEDYFLKNDLIRTLIQRHYDESPMPDYREGHGDLSRVLSFHWVDFILGKKSLS